MKSYILIDGKTFSLESNISVVLRSPVFPDNQNNGSFVFTFSMALTLDLKKVLGFAHRPSSAQKLVKKEITIKSGSFQVRGSARISRISQDKAEVSMALDNGLLSEIFSGLRLPQIPLESVQEIVPFICRAKVSEPVEVEHWGSGPGIATRLLAFDQIIEDPHGLLSLAGNTYTVPQSGVYLVYLSFSFSVKNAGSMYLRILKNNAVSVEKPITAAGGSTTFSLVQAMELSGGDTLRMVVATELIFWESHMDDDPQGPIPIDTYHGSYTINSATNLSIFSESDFDQVAQDIYPHSLYTLAPIYNDSFFANAKQSVFVIDSQDLIFLGEKFPVVNYFEKGSFPAIMFRTDEDGEYLIHNTFCPLTYVAGIIDGIFKALGISLVNNEFMDPDLLPLCMYSHISINSMDVFGLNPVSNSFELSDTLADIQAVEFFTQICKTFGIAFQYSGAKKSLRMKSLYKIMDDMTSVPISQDVAPDPQVMFNEFSGFALKYQDYNDGFVSAYFKDLDEVNLLGVVEDTGSLPEQASVGDCYFVQSENAYFNFGHNEQDNILEWMLYSLDFSFSYEEEIFSEFSENLLEITLPTQPIMMRWSPREDPTYGADERDLLLPATQRAGYLEGIKKPEHHYYVGFYRGMHPDGNMQDYPLFTNSIFSLLDKIPMHKSLLLSLSAHPASLYTRRWKKYLHWRVKADGIYTFFKKMRPGQLVDFDFFVWYNIHGVDYLIKELRFDITPDGISWAELTCIPRVYLEDIRDKDLQD